jgi:hypothetical protein
VKNASISMADVFLSYAREDQPRARRLAAALVARGWTVWWDHVPIPGEAVASYIDENPNDAGCVVVLWSMASLYSDFVRNEAAIGDRRQKLVEVIFERGVASPRIWSGAIDLGEWNGESSGKAFDRLTSVIRKMVGPSLPVAAAPQVDVDRNHDQLDAIESTRADGESPKTARRRAPLTSATSARKPRTKPRPPLPADSPPVVRRIFLCYRRDDSGVIVGRIYDRLAREFGDDNVFKDIDNIPFGVDFVDHLDREVQKCDVLFAVIGARWLDARLDDPNDFVRIEIASALHRTIPVVPILVDGAQMPRADQLPEQIKGLARRNGTMVRHDPDFHSDLTRLLARLG